MIVGSEFFLHVLSNEVEIILISKEAIGLHDVRIL